MTHPPTRRSPPRERLLDLLLPRKGEARRLWLGVLCGALGQLAAIGLLATAGWLITTSALRPPVLTLTVAIAAVRLFALVRGTARYGERLASHDLALRVLARIRVYAFLHLEPYVPGELSTTRRGDLLARFVSDVDGLQDLYVRVIVPLGTTAVTIALTTAAGLLLDPLAGGVLAAGLFTGALVLPLATGLAGQRGGATIADRRGVRDALIVEALHGAAELRLFGADEAFAHRLGLAEGDLTREIRRSSLASTIGLGASVALSGLLCAAVITASLPALGRGGLTGVEVAVLAFLALAGAEAISSLPDSLGYLGTTLGGARRILDLAERPVVTGGSALPCPCQAPSFSLLQVSVSYDGERTRALCQVELTLRAGEHVAIVGESGSGKSTVASLLLGFVRPEAGRVTLCGVDLAELDPEASRSLIAWAPEQPHIFHASLAANLRLARPPATDAELLAVLAAVGLAEWAAGLERGLESTLGERGTTLSGGERQRLGVARALLADRPVLLLDEPTAHLDAANEEELQESVLARSAGRSLLWITHRRLGLDRFDRVVCLERGRVGLPG